MHHLVSRKHSISRIQDVKMRQLKSNQTELEISSTKRDHQLLKLNPAPKTQEIERNRILCSVE